MKKPGKPTLKPAPTRDKCEAANWKRHEAEFFLPMLKQYDHQNSIEFRYVFNAFLAAARAGHAFLREADKARYDAWVGSLTPQDQEILFAARTARDLAVHQDGPSINQGGAVSYVPTPGNYRHTIQLERSDGTTVVLPAVGVGSRYLGLMFQALDRYRR